MDPFLGEIRLFPWGWAPAGWLPCEGQILPFNSNIALASLWQPLWRQWLYHIRSARPARPGRAWPELCSFNVTGHRHPHTGIQRWRRSRKRHQYTGSAYPHHAHVSTDPGNSGPANSIPAVEFNSQGAVSKPTYVAAAGATMTSLNSMTVVSPPGDGIPNMQPSIVTYFCIATVGIYPPRQ